MNRRTIKRVGRGLALVALATALLGGCARREPPWPPAIDYERLDRRMASLRAEGVIGPRGFDEEAWVVLELRLRQAEAYLARQQWVDRAGTADILARVERGMVLRSLEQERERQEMLEYVLARRARLERYTRQGLPEAPERDE